MAGVPTSKQSTGTATGETRTAKVEKGSWGRTEPPTQRVPGPPQCWSSHLLGHIPAAAPGSSPPAVPPSGAAAPRCCRVSLRPVGKNSVNSTNSDTVLGTTCCKLTKAVATSTPCFVRTFPPCAMEAFAHIHQCILVATRASLGGS